MPALGIRIKSLVKPFVAPAHRHLVIEDFPLKVCQTERASNLLSGEAFVRAASALFCPSLLILFLHNGLTESTSSGGRMDEDEDVDGMDGCWGASSKAGPGLGRGSSGP